MHDSTIEYGPTFHSHEPSTPQPDYPQISELIKLQERELFGAPGIGVFDPVASTRQSRLDGLLGVLGNFEEYKDFNDMPHDKFQKLKTRLNDKKKIDGQSKTIGEILDGGHDVLRAIYINKVLDNDPLVQTLYEIQNHEPPLRENAYEELVDDSLIVFAKDSLEAIIKQTIKKL
jgi:hypothetical protein